MMHDTITVPCVNGKLVLEVFGRVGDWVVTTRKKHLHPNGKETTFEGDDFCVTHDPTGLSVVFGRLRTLRSLLLKLDEVCPGGEDPRAKMAEIAALVRSEGAFLIVQRTLGGTSGLKKLWLGGVPQGWKKA